MVGPEMLVLFEKVEIVLDEKPLHVSSLSYRMGTLTDPLRCCRGMKISH